MGPAMDLSLKELPAIMLALPLIKHLSLLTGLKHLLLVCWLVLPHTFPLYLPGTIQCWALLSQLSFKTGEGDGSSQDGWQGFFLLLEQQQPFCYWLDWGCMVMLHDTSPPCCSVLAGVNPAVVLWTEYSTSREWMKKLAWEGAKMWNKGKSHACSAS